MRPDQEKDRTFFIDKSSGVDLETVKTEPFIDWLVDTKADTDQPNYKQYGTTLEIVTDRSQEGSQFVKGFGGIGGKRIRRHLTPSNISSLGLLRYQVDFAAQEVDFSDDDFDLDDY